MTTWSEPARGAITKIAESHGFGADAGEALAAALVAGDGRMAQFRHEELGGMGQWTRGGMLMIGDMFNNELKARVASLAEALAAAIDDGTVAPDAVDEGEDAAAASAADAPSSGSAGAGLRASGAPRLSGQAWWPRALGQPSSSGSQNGRRYAAFPDSHRLAVETGGTVTLYDTGDHAINGFSQSQGGSDSLRFTSQHGTIDIRDLTEVRADEGADASPAAPSGKTETAGLRKANAPRLATAADFPAVKLDDANGAKESDRPSANGNPDVIDTIHRLGELRDRNLITQEEFAAKKADLLGRL